MRWEQGTVRSNPDETLVIELLDLAGRSLSILRLHVNFGDLCYGPYPGRDKVYKSEREVYHALGKLAQEKLIRDIRIPAEEIQEKKDREKWSNRTGKGGLE